MSLINTSLRRRRWLSVAGAVAIVAIGATPALAGGPKGGTALAGPAALVPAPAGTTSGSLQGVAAITGARAALVRWCTRTGRGRRADRHRRRAGSGSRLSRQDRERRRPLVRLAVARPRLRRRLRARHAPGKHHRRAATPASTRSLRALRFVGIAPAARIINVRAGDALGRVDVTQVIAALDWVVENQHANGMNIRVICLAYGTDSTQSYKTDPLAHAVENAWRHGIVVVTSAGNAGFGGPKTSPGLTMPAADPMVIAVGGADPHGTLTTADDTAAGFSSGGADKRNPDFLAPAVSVAGLRVPGSTVDELYGATAGDGPLIRGSGTSQAAAVVAGLVADLLSARPALTPDQVKALLGSKATKLPKVDPAVQGFGEVNLVNAGLADVPATKPMPASPGGGSIDASRGTNHPVHEGVTLAGDVDWFGRPISGAALATAENSGTAWIGDSWLGAVLTNAPWLLPSWDGSDWTSRTWRDEGWDTRSWRDASWTSRTWRADAWLGDNWTSRTWRDSTWQ